MREVGLHLRYNGSFAQVARKALELNIPFFQCFLMPHMDGPFVVPAQQDIDEFVQLRRDHFGSLYVHGSYWINLAGLGYGGKRALQQEIELAKRLEFTHMILHPGAAWSGCTKQQGIERLATSVNQLLEREHDIIIVLENTAHGGASVGGDLNDFVALRALLDAPEKIKICIDTAHAYCYGYDIATPAGRAAFIDLLNTTVGYESIVLIHLNDTNQACGSKIDKHYIPGEGKIGTEALKALVIDKNLATLPLLMELPLVTSEQEATILHQVRGW